MPYISLNRAPAPICNSLSHNTITPLNSGLASFVKTMFLGAKQLFHILCNCYSDTPCHLNYSDYVQSPNSHPKSFVGTLEYLGAGNVCDPAPNRQACDCMRMLFSCRPKAYCRPLPGVAGGRRPLLLDKRNSVQDNELNAFFNGGD